MNQLKMIAILCFFSLSAAVHADDAVQPATAADAASGYTDIVAAWDVPYDPDPAVLSSMTKEKACHDFIKYGKKADYGDEFRSQKITDIKLISGGFEYDYLGGVTRKTITLFDQIKMLGIYEVECLKPSNSASYWGYFVRAFINTTQGGNRYLWFDYNAYPPPPTAMPDASAKHFQYLRARKDARHFQDALSALLHHPEWTTNLDNYQYVADDMDDFDQIVKKYHAHKGKMLLSQEVRKFYIQAQDAVNEKRYDDAIELYNNALEAAPWWALGYYNCGFIMADQGDNEDAIDYFKKYLKLEPKAKDSQDVQDKIYSLEGKLGK